MWLVKCRKQTNCSAPLLISPQLADSYVFRPLMMDGEDLRQRKDCVVLQEIGPELEAVEHGRRDAGVLADGGSPEDPGGRGADDGKPHHRLLPTVRCGDHRGQPTTTMVRCWRFWTVYKRFGPVRLAPCPCDGVGGHVIFAGRTP